MGALSQSMVLGVPCSAMLNRFDSTQAPRASRTRAQHRWQHLPLHKEVRVRATIHFIDSWHGSVAMLRSGSELLWTESPPAAPSGTLAVDMCGTSTEGDSGINKVVDVVFPHAGDALTLEFGVAYGGASCTASLGIDDLEVWVR